jgi:predicted AAA+ superfamily ATPase
MEEFNSHVDTLIMVFNMLIPPREKQTDDERMELWRLAAAIDYLQDVSDMAYKALEDLAGEHDDDKVQQLRKALDESKAALDRLPTPRAA